MSVYIVLERAIEGFDPYVNGRALAELSEQDAEISAAAGTIQLMSFFSQSPAEASDFLEGEGIDPSEYPVKEEWFSASDGLATLATLQKHYGEKADVAQEIQEWQKVLGRAKAEGIRWHLAVDY